jgi:hypothetical protein
VGNLIGAGDELGARRAARLALLLGAGVMSLFGAAFFLLRWRLPHLYGAEPAVTALCARVLPIAAAFQMLDGTVGSGTGAVVYRMPLGCVRRFRLRARLEVPSLRLRPPPHRTGQADFPHPAHREGVFHRGYASVQLGHAFALQYTTR